VEMKENEKDASEFKLQKELKSETGISINL